MQRHADRAVNSTEVVDALRTSYGEGWKLVEQVGDSTGSYTRRHLDVLAISLWPSRGLEIHGIEIKVSKSDLKHELASPEKAEAVADRCDRFFLATPAGLANSDDLARLVPNWGLLEVTDERGRRVVKTVRPAALLEPKAIARDFVAAVLRRIPEPTEAMRTEMRDALRAEIKIEYDKRLEDDVERQTRKYKQIAERARRFSEISGIDLLEESEWNSGWRGLSIESIASAVKFLASQDSRYGGASHDLLASAGALRRQAEQIIAAASKVETIAAALPQSQKDIRP